MNQPSTTAGRAMRLIAWKPVVKGSLRGFASVELPIGLTIADCPVLAGRNGAWVALPGKPQLNSDGSPRRDASGKPAYASILSWADRDLQDRFSKAVIALVLTKDPDAIDGHAP